MIKQMMLITVVGIHTQDSVKLLTIFTYCLSEWWDRD